MAITIQPTNLSTLYAEAGKMVGEAKRKEKEQIAAREAEQQKHQKEMQNTAQQWEMQKMLLNSQQDFAHEQRVYQARLEAEARSREWEVEKMEIASKLDFEREEKERQRKLNKESSIIERLKEEIASGRVDENDLSVQNKLAYHQAQYDAVDAGWDRGPSYTDITKMQGVSGGAPRGSLPWEEQEEYYNRPTAVAKRERITGTAPLTMSQYRDFLEDYVGGSEYSSLEFLEKQFEQKTGEKPIRPTTEFSLITKPGVINPPASEKTTNKKRQNDVLGLFE